MLVLSSCQGGGSADAGPVGDAFEVVRVELGTGTSGFEPIAEGADLELVAGPQGGWHVWVTARIWNSRIDGLIIDYEAVPVGGTEPVSMPTQLELRADRVVHEGDHFLRAGDFVVMDITGPSDLVGVELVLRVRITDTTGRSASDERRVTIVDRLP